jgi:hypothetical protein
MDLASTERILFCLVLRPERDTPGWKLALSTRQELGSRLTEISLDALTEDESQRWSQPAEIEALGRARSSCGRQSLIRRR